LWLPSLIPSIFSFLGKLEIADIKDLSAKELGSSVPQREENIISDIDHT
jgi:hypothetical protein